MKTTTYLLMILLSFAFFSCNDSAKKVTPTTVISDKDNVQTEQDTPPNPDLDNPSDTDTISNPDTTDLDNPTDKDTISNPDTTDLDNPSDTDIIQNPDTTDTETDADTTDTDEQPDKDTVLHECNSDTDCGINSNPCQQNKCIQFKCVAKNIQGSCDDKNPCTINDQCNAGVCKGTIKSCDDSNPCTNDSCDPTNGQCKNVTKDCEDGNLCTNDTCDPMTGKCQHKEKSCDDGNICTNDSCAPVDGHCIHQNAPNPCDDGNACTINDTCNSGKCVGLVHLDCNDGDPCTVDSCDPATGCKNTQKTCDDNNLCTNDSCNPSDGSCKHTSVSCDDNKFCTVDSCNPISGCVHHPKVCPDDNLFCNGGEYCNESKKACDHEGNPCLSTSQFCSETENKCCNLGYYGEDCKHCIRFVNIKSAIDTPNGFSWNTAFTNIQDGIDSAKDEADISGRTCDVWVAEGTYYVFRTSKTDSIKLAENVNLLGGFKGDETEESQRDFNLNGTILNGCNNSSCSVKVYSVVTAKSNSKIDGFAIKNGKSEGVIASNGLGGGLYSKNVENLTISNIFFSGNTAIGGETNGDGLGGAVYSENSTINIKNCMFSHNESKGTGTYHEGNGGAIYAIESTINIENALFSDNLSEGKAASSGGAIYFQDSKIEILKSRFKKNKSNFGGAVYITDSKGRIQNSLFFQNKATEGRGGAIRTGEDVDLSINFSTFNNNSATKGGGAVAAKENGVTINSGILWNDSANTNEELENVNSVTYSDINYAGVIFPGEGNINADPKFLDEIGGNLKLSNDSPCIDSATHLNYPNEDIDGIKRFKGSAPDMGAYEIK